MKMQCEIVVNTPQENNGEDVRIKVRRHIRVVDLVMLIVTIVHVLYGSCVNGAPRPSREHLVSEQQWLGRR
jgi:hypothetical protein